MSYSRSVQCSKRYLTFDSKAAVSFLPSVTKNQDKSKCISARKQLLLILRSRSSANLPHVNHTHRFSYFYATKPYTVFFPRQPYRSNSSINQPSGIGGIENEDGPLTKDQADDLVLRLTEEERKALLTALQEYNSNQVKAEYEGQLAATRWRSKFGRPSKLPTLGDVDPTGSYCHLSEDWLKKKYAEKVPAPTSQQLVKVAIFNAVPFVGFGFLDNFIMICAGDYIDETLGSLVTISTMAAAALGNTISDVMGIGSAWYVELFAAKVGLKPPNLSPIQLDMKSARRAANLGRALGITVGCLLGMLPLLFIKKEDSKKKEKVKA